MSIVLPVRRRALLLAGFAVPLAAHAEDAGPAARVTALCDALRAPHVGFAERAAALAPVVGASFDLQAVLRAVVGPRYAGLTEADRASLLDVFTRYTVASYAANFVVGPNDRIAVLPQTRAAGADQVVGTQITPAAAPPTRLDYQVRRGEAGWKIVDVLIDGAISQVAVQRSDFRSLLAGGGADRLIASLRAKTATLAAGGKG